MLFYSVHYVKGIYLFEPSEGLSLSPSVQVVSQRSTYNGPYWEGLALGGAGGLGRLANLGRLKIRP